MNTNEGSWRSRRLYRSTEDRLLGGVGGGLGEYFGVDPTLIRLLFVLAVVVTGGAVLLAYPVLWVIVPPASRLAGAVQDEPPQRAADIPPTPTT